MNEKIRKDNLITELKKNISESRDSINDIDLAIEKLREIDIQENSGKASDKRCWNCKRYQDRSMNDMCEFCIYNPSIYDAWLPEE